MGRFDRGVNSCSFEPERCAVTNSSLRARKPVPAPWRDSLLSSGFAFVHDPPYRLPRRKRGDE
jgi:hypothetical protein